MKNKYLSAACFFARYTIMVLFFIMLTLISDSSSSIDPDIIADLKDIIPPILFYVASFLVVWIAYYSIARSFSITDPRIKHLAEENKDSLTNFTERASLVLKTPNIYFETIIVSFFFAVTSYSTVFIQMFSPEPNGFYKFTVTVFIILCAFVMSFFAKVSAIQALNFKESFEVIKFGRGEKKYGIRYIIGNCVLLSFAYPIALTMIPYIFAIAVIPFRFNTKDTLTIISIILVVVALLLTVRYWVALSKRRKFLKKLRNFCKENKFALENECNMIKSVFKEYEGANFVIKANGKRYACKFIASQNKGNPMYFTENGDLYIVKNRSLTFLTSARGMGSAMINNMSISKRATVSSFAFESQYTKLVIVNPIPTKIFAGHPEHSMAIDVGSRVGDYRIYNASGFLNALERNCVEK